MTPYKKRMNPYIRRMAEDMQLRNLAPATIDAYTFHVDKFCQHFGKSAEQLGPDEIREYQLYLVNEKQSSWSSFNQAVCGLRFLYEVTLSKPWAVRHIPFGKRPKKLPTVLSDQEASRLLQCVTNPKHRAVLLTCYAAGLRIAEATHLRVADVEGAQRARVGGGAAGSGRRGGEARGEPEQGYGSERQRSNLHDEFLPAPLLTRVALGRIEASRGVSGVAARLRAGERMLRPGVGRPIRVRRSTDW